MTRRLMAMVLCCILALPAASPGQAPGGVGDDSYRIQASDVLRVKYRYTPEYDSTVTVMPDGCVSLPIVGQVSVAGLSVTEAVAAIQTMAGQRLRDPEVAIELQEFEKPRFFVGGEVGKPGQFELRGRVHVLEAIAMAGGFKSSAKHSQVVLFRRQDGEQALRVVVNAKALARTGAEEDVVLQPGDLLFVPQNRISKASSLGPFTGLGVLLNALLFD